MGEDDPVTYCDPVLKTDCHDPFRQYSKNIPSDLYFSLKLCYIKINNTVTCEHLDSLYLKYIYEYS